MAKPRGCLCPHPRVCSAGRNLVLGNSLFVLAPQLSQMRHSDDTDVRGQQQEKLEGWNMGTVPSAQFSAILKLLGGSQNLWFFNK